MSKKSIVKKPLSAFRCFVDNRKKELFVLTGLPPREVDELAREEWSLMTPEDKLPFEEAYSQQKDYYETNKDQLEEIDVDSFMTTIKEARKNKQVQDEFKEDAVLSILNHKQKWKKTWTKRKKEKERLHKTVNPVQAKKLAKLRLN